jgi:hypothetical protein
MPGNVTLEVDTMQPSPVADHRPLSERTVQTARLGIDFGTSHTVAVLGRPSGRADALLFESSPLLPSAVYLAGDETMLVGRDAERSARIEPAAYEPHPKRRIDEGSVLLDGRDVPVEQLIEAILRRVGGEACRILGGPPAATVLTHPAGWGPTRRALLTTAAGTAGLTGVTLVAEPVAAAMYFTGVLGHRVPDGHAVVVYDFGGGTFDISVVRRTGDGWHVAAANGLDDVGGVDLDAAVVDWTRANVTERAPELWQRLERPATVADRRHRRALWEDARSTKELLSRATSAGMAVPLFDVDVYLTRPEFETLARPWLDRTVALTTTTLFASDVTAGRLAGVFLVGGASRVPLVATLLHQALGIAPVVLEQPELVVAHGSLLADAPATAAPAPPTVPVQTPPRAAESLPDPAPVPDPVPASPRPVGVAAVGALTTAAGRGGRRPRRWIGGGFLTALALIIGLGVLSLLVRDSYDRVAPPFLAGLLTPLLPKSVLVLVAMITWVVVGGTPGAPPTPAYRALGPALVAAGGGVIGLFLLALSRDADNAISISDDSYSSGGDVFSPGALWIVTGAAVAIILSGLYLTARPPSTDPVTAPGRRSARLAWFGLWAAAGALLVLASTSLVRRAYVTFNDNPVEDVQPLAGVLNSSGELSWWGAYLLALTLMIGAALLLGAALRIAVTHNPAVHRDARRVGYVLVAECGGLLLLNTAWERADGRVLAEVHNWYWGTFVRLDNASGGHPTLWLLLAVAATAGVAVPSLVRSARTARRSTARPEED